MTAVVTAVLVAFRCTLAAASDTPDVLRARAADAFYNLDYEQAEALYREVLAIAPGDVRAHRGIATVQWLKVAFARGTVCVDEFLVGRTPQSLALAPPAPAVAQSFRDHMQRALDLSERAALARPRDAEARFQYGASVGLRAMYTATVEGRLFRAIASARAAYDAHERVMTLDPSRVDAGLIVGMYRYVVSTLSLPGRWVAYLAGFGGGRETGLHMVEAAAAFRSESQPEARLALVLLYNREQRYGDALRVLAELQRAFPRNRLLWLEAAATALRGNRVAEAASSVEEGLRRLSADPRPRARGEAALWRLTLGRVRLAERALGPARASLRAALAPDARDWVRARAHLELAQAARLEGHASEALAESREAERLAVAARDERTVREARRIQAALR